MGMQTALDQAEDERCHDQSPTREMEVHILKSCHLSIHHVIYVCFYWAYTFRILYVAFKLRSWRRSWSWNWS